MSDGGGRTAATYNHRPGAVLERLQKVANRITLGLIIAALILGAAMMMRIDTSFRLFGYPGLAMILFMAAATAGLWLGYGIIAADRAHGRPVLTTMSNARLSRAGGAAGHRFKSPNRYGLPAFCTLHVRAWKPNPNGGS